MRVFIPDAEFLQKKTMIEKNESERFQTYLALYDADFQSETEVSQSAVEVDQEKEVAKLKLPNKQDMKAKYDKILVNSSK